MDTDNSHLSHLGDPRRLRVLAGIDLDNPELQQRLNAVAESTARRLGLPISLVSVVLDTAQFLAGAHGVEGWIATARGTPVEWSFCAHAVASGRPYIVPDATIDTRQSANPLVTVDGVRSYAGIPLILDGEVLGAHCVIGTEAHDFSDEDLGELARGAAEITELLQQYRAAE